MTVDLLIDNLNKIHPVSVEMACFLKEKIKVFQLKNQEILYHQGDSLHHVYFVMQGLLVGKTFQDERSYSSFFLKENDYLCEIESFIKKERSTFSVSAIEPSVLLMLHYQNLRLLYQKFPESNYIFRHLLEINLTNNRQYSHLLQKLNYTARYLKFIELNPWALQRLKLGQIAIYLNMSPETLSRIRNSTVKGGRI